MSRITTVLLLLVITSSCVSRADSIPNTAEGEPFPPDIQVDETHLDDRKHEASHWPQEEIEIGDPSLTNGVETNDGGEDNNSLNREHLQGDHLNRRPLQGDQLNVLLNCKPFRQFVRLLKDAQRDLLSYLPAKSSRSTRHRSKTRSPLMVRRTRTWIRKFHKKIKGVYKSCLSLTALRDILETHLDATTFSRLGQEMPGTESLEIARSVSTNADMEGIFNIASESKDVSKTANRNTRPVSTQRRLPVMNSRTILPLNSRDFRKKAARLGKVLSEMMLKNNEIDAITILQGILTLDQEESHRNVLPKHHHSKDISVSAKLGGVLREIPTYFLSVTLGSKIMEHGKLRQIARSTRLRTLTRGLSPAVLRVGGSSANFVTYNPASSQSISSSSHENQDASKMMFSNVPSSAHVPNSHDVGETIKDEEANLSIVSPNTNPNVEGGMNNSTEGNEFHTPPPGAETHQLEDDSDSSSFPVQSDEANPQIQEASPSMVDGLCPFAFKWHSYYKTKPQSNSSYNLLAAMSASASREATNDYMRDQPSLDGIHECSVDTMTRFENFTITAEDWDNLTDFAEDVGMKLLFDINQFYRTDDGNWDPSNARMILQMAAARNDDVLWQLGNEPNAYYHKFGFNLTGRRDAQDFHQLHQELIKHFKNPAIIGPDVTRPRIHHGLSLSDEEKEKSINKESIQFLQDFLSNLELNLTALAWHQYYVDSRTATLEDFTSIATLNMLSAQIPQVVRLRNQLIPGTPIWLTETSSAWGGGAPGLSNSYVAGFLWLDKLGLSAVEGIDVVARQTLYYGCYSLIDPNFIPYPDYWLSLLFKELVGEKVLRITTKGPTTVRLYAHCQSNSSSSYEPGNVVVYGMNVANTTATVHLEGMSSNYTIQQYLLEPVLGELQSRHVVLNGELLSMTPDEELPELKPLPLPDQKFRLPATTFGFWVIENTHANECM